PRDVDEGLSGEDDGAVAFDLRGDARAQRELHIGCRDGKLRSARLEQDSRQDLHRRAGRERARDDAERLRELVLCATDPQPCTHHDALAPGRLRRSGAERCFSRVSRYRCWPSRRRLIGSARTSCWRRTCCRKSSDSAKSMSDGLQPVVRNSRLVALLVAIGVLLLGLFRWRDLNLESFLNALAGVRWGWAVTAVAFNLLSAVAGSLAWNTIIREAF